MGIGPMGIVLDQMGIRQNGYWTKWVKDQMGIRPLGYQTRYLDQMDLDEMGLDQMAIGFELGCAAENLKFDPSQLCKKK